MSYNNFFIGSLFCASQCIDIYKALFIV